jgi:hypothetical protein
MARQLPFRGIAQFQTIMIVDDFASIRAVVGIAVLTDGRSLGEAPALLLNAMEIIAAHDYSAGARGLFRLKMFL